MLQRLKNILIGEPLTQDNSGDDHLLSKVQALAMLSSDALSSIAYGPEQVVLVLMAVSSAAIWWSIPIGVLVLVLLASLTISYRQVIKAYPQGGGAYMVTSENLSPKFGLIAGGSLLVDYMLTVAVSVASGADAITSAIPLLHPYNLEISMILVLVLMVMNLRGMRESAKSLMIPVYLFIVSTMFLLGFGFLQILTGHMPYAATAHLGQPITGVSVILILRAFTSGSASLTGVEAISNAVPFFKKPKPKNAASTLFIMSSILGIMFAGITFLNWWTGITPHSGVTILAQMAREILGYSWIGSILFYIFQFSTAMILAVAANTGFSAFPMLSFNMAKNKYMPHMYLEKGARMGYSNGILTLAIGAITHWIREYGKGFWKHSLANILGALICYAIVLILFLFRLGDIWPFFPIIAILMWMFLKIKKHYNGVAQQLRIDGQVKEHHYQGNIVLILVGNVTKANIGAISYARSIGDKVIAMHVSTKDTENKDKETEQEFKKYFPEIEMVHIQSPYSSITQSTIQYVDEVATQAEKENATLTVMIPQFVPKKSWQTMLHNQMSLRLKYYLKWRENIVISSYSYHLKD